MLLKEYLLEQKKITNFDKYKPYVPDFLAEWFENCKGDPYKELCPQLNNPESKIYKWFLGNEEEASFIFTLMENFGYHIEPTYKASTKKVADWDTREISPIYKDLTTNKLFVEIPEKYTKNDYTDKLDEIDLVNNGLINNPNISITPTVKHIDKTSIKVELLEQLSEIKAVVIPQIFYEFFHLVPMKGKQYASILDFIKTKPEASLESIFLGILLGKNRVFEIQYYEAFTKPLFLGDNREQKQLVLLNGSLVPKDSLSKEDQIKADPLIFSKTGKPENDNIEYKCWGKQGIFEYALIREGRLPKPYFVFE